MQIGANHIKSQQFKQIGCFHRVASCHIWHAWSKTSPSSAFCPSRRATACSAVCCYENGTDAKLEIHPSDNSTIALVLPLSARHLLLEPAIVAEASEHWNISYQNCLPQATAVFYFLRKSAKRQKQVNVFGRTLCTNKVLELQKHCSHQDLVTTSFWATRTNGPPCSVANVALIGFEWIWHDLTFHPLIVKGHEGTRDKIQHIVTVPLKHFRS